MEFDSVVFADSACSAVLSCFARLKSDRDAGRRTLVVALVDASGSDVIQSTGLATVRPFNEAGAAASPQPWRERLSVTIRGLGASHVMAPLGLLASPRLIDYFSLLRAALNVDNGRDLLFFEERPECLVREAVLLRLSTLGIRLPPASHIRSPRRYGIFALRLITGLGVPPVFGGLRQRLRYARSMRTAFRDAVDWDPQRALGPKLQPVAVPWTETDSIALFILAAALGQDRRFGSARAFRRAMSRHAADAGSRTSVERYWLSLPGPLAHDPVHDDEV